MSVPGPEILGRSVVVDGAAHAPDPWGTVPEVVIDEAALAEPGAVVGVLHQAWARRTPVVIRLAVDPARFRTPPDLPVEPWTLPAAFELWHDRLQFVVWANAYDARHPGPPVWWWARKALRLGATSAADRGDVVLPDGTPCWVDGGPRQPLDPARLDGLAVVHRETVERDRLTPARPPVAAHAGELAADQAAAVGHQVGPARVVAPAGSGKTRVLTERLRHLVVDRGWERESVLAVAYNRKAREELEARTSGFRPRTRTLNALGLALLGEARGTPPEVLDEREVRRIVERLAPSGRRRVNTDPVAPYLEALGAVRLGLRDPEEVEAGRDDVSGLAELWPAFRDELRRRNAVDFDDQVYGAVEVLLADGALRARAQLSHRHLLVDEFQDLTPAHLLLLRLLVTPTLDCFGVGDDDQVIYGHAGADPGFLIGYERLFPDGGDHPLQVNYRCPPEVVDAAVSLLSYNRRRVPKTIRAGRATGERGLEIRRHPPGGGAADAVEVVRSWLDGGVSPGSIAVLARVNALLLAPHVALAEAGVPVESVVRPELLSRTGLRAALAYLRLATAPDGGLDGRDLVEILRRPSRGLPPWFADRLRRRPAWGVDGLFALAAGVADREAPKVEALVDDVVALRSAAAAGADSARLLRLVRTDIGLGGAMTLLDGGRGGEGASHLDDLEALEQVAVLHPDPTGLEDWIRRTLDAPPAPGGVVLSTVHRVKGMEWDRVVVYGVTAGILPHRLAEDDEEERRVLHVGITRGRQRVVVCADAARPSPFLDELTGEAPHLPAPVAPRSPGAATATAPSRRSRPAGGAGGEDPVLADALRSWRRERARADGVPAYVVFADRTLLAIATVRPTTLAALRTVDGIGPTKLELYGDELLQLVGASAPDAG